MDLRRESGISVLFYGTNGVHWGRVFSCTQTIVTVYPCQKNLQSREAMRCIPRNLTVTGSILTPKAASFSRYWRISKEKALQDRVHPPAHSVPSLTVCQPL